MRIAVAGGTGVVGHYTVEAAEQAGHEPVVIARSTGVDTVTGQGLAEALRGVDVIIDATNIGTTEEAAIREFFLASTRNLASAGLEAGVQRLIVLSIIGVDRVTHPHYTAKVAQEQAALAGPLPATIVRASPFHELAGQLIMWSPDGDVAQIPNLHVQPVAARTVGEQLVAVAQSPTPSPGPYAREVAGPEKRDMAALSERFAERFELDVHIDGVDTGAPPEAQLPAPGAFVGGPTFDQWLDSEDAARIGAAARRA